MALLVEQHGVMVAVVAVVDPVEGAGRVGVVAVQVAEGHLVALLLPVEGVLQAVQVVAQVLLVHVVEGVSPPQLHVALPLSVGQVPAQGRLTRHPPPMLLLGVSPGVLQLLPHDPCLPGG